MARDTQIVSSADHEAPKDYTIPGNAELILRAVQATFTDNGASGDWLPCVTLITDSGHTIARAIDRGVVITAGSDASVSWFPGVKAAAAAATGGTKIFVATTRISPWPNNGAPGGDGKWNQLYNDDASVFSFTNLFQDTVEITAPGKYLIATSAHWNTNVLGTNAWANAAGAVMSYAVFTTGVSATHWAIGGLFQQNFQDLCDLQICVVPSTAGFPLTLYMDGFQSSGADQTANANLIAWQLDAAT